MLTPFTAWFANRLAARAQASIGVDPVVQTEQVEHRSAVVQAVRWAVLAVIRLIALILVLERLGVPLTSVVAPASVAGVAIGVGAQRVVPDILAGFFIVTGRAGSRRLPWLLRDV